MPAWVPAIIVALVGSLVSIAVAFTVVREKANYLADQAERLENQENRLETHLERAARELNAAVTTIAVMQREQSVINAMSAKTLESIANKVEILERRVSDQGATIILLGELVKRLEKVNIV